MPYSRLQHPGPFAEGSQVLPANAAVVRIGLNGNQRGVGVVRQEINRGTADIRSAIHNQMHVVQADQGPIFFHYQDLQDAVSVAGAGPEKQWVGVSLYL
jgi:hypothetical protein